MLVRIWRPGQNQADEARKPEGTFPHNEARLTPEGLRQAGWAAQRLKRGSEDCRAGVAACYHAPTTSACRSATFFLESVGQVHLESAPELRGIVKPCDWDEEGARLLRWLNELEQKHSPEAEIWIWCHQNTAGALIGAALGFTWANPEQFPLDHARAAVLRKKSGLW